MTNERGHTELHLDDDEIGVHIPFDTADAAYLQFGLVEIHYDASTREGREKAFKQLARIRRLADNLESHLRVIRVAPEHQVSSEIEAVTASQAPTMSDFVVAHEPAPESDQNDVYTTVLHAAVPVSQPTDDTSGRQLVKAMCGIYGAWAHYTLRGVFKRFDAESPFACEKCAGRVRDALA